MEGARRTLLRWREPGGPSRDGGSQEDPLEMEGARRTLSRWREPGRLSRDGGSQEDPLKMEGARRTLSRCREPGGLSQDGEARGLSSDGGSQITLSGWREPWRKRRVPEKEVQQGGLRPLQPVCRRGFKGSA